MCTVPNLIDWCILWYYLFLCYLFIVTVVNFEGVLWIYIATLWGTSWLPLYYVFCMWNKQTFFNACYSWSLFVACHDCMHSYYVLLLELHLSCTSLEFFDPSLQCLQMVWSWFWWCMSPQKNSFYHLPTRGRAGVKLGDAWYVGNVSIIFYAPWLLSIYFSLLCLHFEVFLYVFWY